MRRGFVGPLVATLLILTIAPSARADVDAQQVREAIDRAIAFLKREQSAEGSWSGYPVMPGGTTGLCTLALLTAGVPPDDPHVARAIDYLLRAVELKYTYVVSLETMVLCAADPRQHGLTIRRNALWLEQQQIREGPRKGSWAYSPDQGLGDKSNSQFAVLALHEAQRAGVEISDQTWRLAQDYWLRTQSPNGSWAYEDGLPGTGSMTCAGIGALVVIADKLDRGSAEVNGDQVICCGGESDRGPIERGLDWLARNFSVQRNPGPVSLDNADSSQWLFYYLYGLERVGRLTNRRLIGDRYDWYREGADLLVRAQDKNLSGFWLGTGHAETDKQVATSLALLFLAKGRRPVLAAKLRHGPDDDWNHHPADLSNLTSYVEKQWKTPLTWQVMEPTATVDDLLQAPVLYLSGSEVPEFSDAQIGNLREYLNSGGFLFAESCCKGGAFDQGFRSVIARMFPEPEYRLSLLPPDHPIWTAEERVDVDPLPELYGVEFGCRTSVVYCPQNLGCYWELDRPGVPARYPAAVARRLTAYRAVGVNVLAYATNRELHEKLDLPRVAADGGSQNSLGRARLAIGQLRHDGGWNSAPRALPNLMRVIHEHLGVAVETTTHDLAFDDPHVFDYHMLFLHGRNAFHLTESERTQLRTFVERGGLVFANSICSSVAFTEAFRREMSLTFEGQGFEPIDAAHPLFSDVFGGFELKTVTRRESRQGRSTGPLPIRTVPPELEGMKFGERYGVIFSKYDLSCALQAQGSLECPGYLAEDAARIALNVALFSLHQ